jgi:hypothetical protein
MREPGAPFNPLWCIREVLVHLLTETLAAARLAASSDSPYPFLVLP